MRSFLKITLASIVGFIIASFLVTFISVMIISALVSSQDEPKEIKSNSVMVLKLNKPIVERKNNDPFENFNPTSMENQAILALNEILEGIQKAKEHENVKGIYLELSVIPGGLATIEEIRNALVDFKSSGKFVYVYSDFLNQRAYYLASVADEIYINPEGVLNMLGLRTELMFFKNTLDKLGIKAQIIRHGKFKAAVEPLMNEKMSEENRNQLTTLIDGIFGSMLDSISVKRNIHRDTLDYIINEMLISKDVELAVKYNVLDGVKYKDEVLEDLKELSGRPDAKKVRAVSLAEVNNTPKKKSHKGLARNKVAVIYAHGDVIMGNEGEGSIASDRIAKAIREARQDSTIKSIVFRVNSGGGSALASEVIWREMKLAAETKTVIASLGDVAASGGYYIVAPADTIMASPTTITGSIGVFGVIPNMQEFFNDKLGITFDVAKTHDHADMYTFSRPLEKEERDMIQYGVEKVYKTFTSHVAEDRPLSVEEVDAIGQGRIWNGIDGKRIGLVDVYGGLTDAIEMAAKSAGIEDQYRVVELPKLEDPLTVLMKKLGNEVKVRAEMMKWGEAYPYFKQLEKIKEMKGVQARIPADIEIY